MVFSDNGPVPTYAQMNVGGMPVTNFSLPQTFSAAPEPSSLVVMGLSGFGLMVGGAIRRRRALTKS
jgi:PAB1-binding protein PBP1